MPTIGRRMTKKTERSTTIAELLHAHELRTGLVDEELGDLIGVHQTQISRWRRGVGVPRESYVPAIAELLDLPEPVVDQARIESERLRVELAEKKSTDPKEELRRVRAELRKARARIARLEERLKE